MADDPPHWSCDKCEGRSVPEHHWSCPRASGRPPDPEHVTNMHAEPELPTLKERLQRWLGFD